MISWNLENPGRLRYPELADQLPKLPDNFEYDKSEPETIAKLRLRNDPFRGKSKWDKQHWRYYRWSYYRNIEYLDAEIGRLLRALRDSGHAEDTLVLFTSDQPLDLVTHP